MSSKTLIEQFVKGGIAAQEAVDAEVAKQQPSKSRSQSTRSFRITNKARALICEIISAADRFDVAAELLADRAISDSLAMNVGRERLSAKELLESLAYRLSYEVRGKKMWHER